jgi:hypothetical protein
VAQYVRRALHARTTQGLPAAIEDRETLDRLASLMAATGVAVARTMRAASGEAGDGAVTNAKASVFPQRRHRSNVGRPRPSANQTGAGSFTTQHAAGYAEDVTPATHPVRAGGAS